VVPVVAGPGSTMAMAGGTGGRVPWVPKENSSLEVYISLVALDVGLGPWAGLVLENSGLKFFGLSRSSSTGHVYPDEF
jgi:hypothetical protein